MIMPFGKHRGKPIRSILASYLLCVLDNCADASLTLREAIKKVLEMDAPTGRAVPSVRFAELVPNRGSHDGVIAVNRAKELFVELVEVQR